MIMVLRTYVRMTSVVFCLYIRAMSKNIQINFILGGESHKVNYEPGDSLLDTALRQGLNAPYSCMEGFCTACGAVVREGEVDFSEDTILTDRETQQGKILTCRAKARIDSPQDLVIDYDAFSSVGASTVVK